MNIQSSLSSKEVSVVIIILSTGTTRRKRGAIIILEFYRQAKDRVKMGGQGWVDKLTHGLYKRLVKRTCL